MQWDLYLTLKVGGIAVFIFAGGRAVARSLGIRRERAFFINGTAAFAGYLVSTLWYIVQHLFGKEPYEFVDPVYAWGDAGAVLYGWVLGGTAALVFMARRFKLDAVRYLDSVLPWLLVAQSMNRLGCFDAGCCFGKPGFPVQLYEAFFDLALFFFIRSRPKRPGLPTFLYFSAYPAARFLFEFMRGDNQPALLFMTVPQVTSVLILALVFRYKKKILSA